jgi:tRNA threonylcarbamoyl adenosine modification protein (Sua5/YciO/YrdC/YwlC family)
MASRSRSSGRALQIHILGFAFDSADPVLNAGLAGIRSGRIERARRMSAELEKVGIGGAFEGAMRYAANPNLVSRAHFGGYLVEKRRLQGPAQRLRVVSGSWSAGLCRSSLGDAGRFAGLDSRRRRVAAVAHPGRYKLSRADMRRFLGEFKDLGGQAIEVMSGSHTPEHVDLFGRLAREYGFLASRGSDFHGPGESYVDLGKLAPLPDGPEARLAAVLSDRKSIMAQYLTIHPDNPQARLLQKAAEVVRQGGVIALPTDSSYALGCHLGDKAAVERIRSLRGVDDRHHLTLMCRDLSQIGQFARVDNARYRLLKATTPGSYTFILEGTRELPRRVLHPRRKTIGLRVPAHTVTLALLEALGEPLLTSTLIVAGDEEPLTEGWEIRDRLDSQLELILDGGRCGIEPTTVVDLTGALPLLVRAGLGALAPVGLD